MDSVTQAALGASVAHLCWNRQLGRRSFLWGVFWGTLPDLDIIIYPFLNDVNRLYLHRAESHSVFFIFFGSFIFARFFPEKWRAGLSFKRIFSGLFLIFATHILIDYFTIYGTQLLAPFSRYGFARGNMYIIDPLYTIPLLAGICASFAAKGRKAFFLNITGFSVSCCYILFSLSSHFYADNIFKKHLKTENIRVIDSITGAAPFNTLLWRHIALTDKGILTGYFSIIGNRPEDNILFELIPRNEHLIKNFDNQINVKAVKWFSKGFYTVKNINNSLVMSDVRFGEIRPDKEASPEKWNYIFSWKISDDSDSLVRVTPETENIKKNAGLMWERLKGNL